MQALTSLLVILVLGSCGASSGEVKSAREASYAADPATLFNEVKTTTEHTYKVAAVDTNTLALRTVPRWYTPDGQVDTKAGDNPSSVQDLSINLTLLVGLSKVDSRSYKVMVEPIVRRKNGLASEPQEVKMTDPSVPGWVQGKIDALQLDIHRKLAGYAVVEPPAAADDRRPAAPSSGW
ncbi:MAG: hypothetical protein ABI867_00670 [Kofleriaceae bacterium]